MMTSRMRLSRRFDISGGRADETHVWTMAVFVGL